MLKKSKNRYCFRQRRSDRKISRSTAAIATFIVAALRRGVKKV